MMLKFHNLRVDALVLLALLVQVRLASTYMWSTQMTRHHQKRMDANGYEKVFLRHVGETTTLNEVNELFLLFAPFAGVE